MKALLFALLISTSGLAQGRPEPVVAPGSDTVIDARYPSVFRYDPPAVYEKWWKEIAACQGLILPVELANAVKFYGVNAETMFVDGEPGIVGYASVYRLEIYVTVGEMWNYETVAHEFLHMLLTWNGIDQGRNWHPELYYSRCRMSRWAL